MEEKEHFKNYYQKLKEIREIQGIKQQENDSVKEKGHSENKKDLLEIKNMTA